MKLPVYLYGHPVLREVATDIDATYPNLSELIANMWETMYHTDGIGIAAPQIGLPIRLFVIDADELKDNYPECRGFKRVMINARIVQETEDTVSYDEGCLSIPGIHEKVTRSGTITIEYLDEQFVPQRETLSGFAARVVQHEYDHIDGVLFIDHIAALRKQLIRKKLNDIVQGKHRASYRTVSAPTKKGK